MDLEGTNYDAVDIPVTRRWRPRMTPYRILVILTSIGLGTAKAILVWQGQTIAPITLEWIAGVVLSLSFQFLVACESKPEGELPYYLRWLFSIDCTKVLWATLAPFSVPRPAYRNDESVIVFRPVPSSIRPPMTGYRLLVSGIAILFGTVKMLCGYLGLSTTANTFDWMFGAVATSVLFYLGLYENNSVGLLPLLFATDYWKPLTSSTYQGLYVAMYATGIAACIAWSGFCLQFLITFPKETYSLPTSKTGTRDNLTPTPIDEIHDYTIRLMVLYAIAACAAAGIACLFHLLRSRKRALMAMRNGARFVWKFIGRHFPSELYALRILPDSEMLQRICAFGVQILVSAQIYVIKCTYILVYTFLHLIGASFFAITTMFLLGFCIRCAFSLYFSDFLVLRICCGMIVCWFAAASIPSVYIIYILLQSLAKALFMYYQTKDVKRSFTVTIRF